MEMALEKWHWGNLKISLQYDLQWVKACGGVVGVVMNGAVPLKSLLFCLYDCWFTSASGVLEVHIQADTKR